MIADAILPAEDEACVRAINNHCDRMSGAMSARWTRWLLASLYMQGYRVFSAYDQHNVKITTAELNTGGEFPLKTSDLLTSVNKIIGLLTSIDLRPKVNREGLSLAAIREKAMAQVIADAVFSKDTLDRIAPDFALFFALYGSCGLCGDLKDSPKVGPTCEVEVVHPREVIPFPDPGADHTKVRGRIRERYVPLDNLRGVYGNDEIAKKLGSMATYEKAIGTYHEPMIYAPVWGTNASPNPMPAATGSSKTTYTVAKYRETFIIGDRNTLVEYVASCGNALLYRRRYDEGQAYCPLSWARFMENGSFHGSGMFDVLFSLIREFEKFIEDLIHNTKSIDRYPTVILPHGTISEKVVMRDTGHGQKFVFANPEPRFDGNPPLRPITIAPHNAGEMPGKTAAYLRQIIDQTTPVRDLIREKGRIDSFPALQFLSEEDSKSVTQPITAMSMAYGDLFRYGVSAAINRYTTKPAPIPISRLDLNLLGAVIDFEKSTVTFSGNMIPDVSRLSFNIKRSPQSEALLKQEAQNLAMFRANLSGGQGDWQNFVLTCLERGIDIPMWIEPEKAAYRMVVQNILTVYNDGTFPGFVFITPHTENPDLQLRVLNSVMAAPEMRLASHRVVDAFIMYRSELMQMTGSVLPPQVPDPYAGVEQPGAGMMPQLA
jgi:hypothetical protein